MPESIIFLMTRFTLLMSQNSNQQNQISKLSSPARNAISKPMSQTIFRIARLFLLESVSFSRWFLIESPQVESIHVSLHPIVSVSLGAGA